MRARACFGNKWTYWKQEQVISLNIGLIKGKILKIQCMEVIRQKIRVGEMAPSHLETQHIIKVDFALCMTYTVDQTSCFLINLALSQRHLFSSHEWLDSIKIQAHLSIKLKQKLSQHSEVSVKNHQVLPAILKTLHTEKQNGFSSWITVKCEFLLPCGGEFKAIKRL